MLTVMWQMKESRVPWQAQGRVHYDKMFIYNLLNFFLENLEIQIHFYLVATPIFAQYYSKYIIFQKGKYLTYTPNKSS